MHGLAALKPLQHQVHLTLEMEKLLHSHFLLLLGAVPHNGELASSISSFLPPPHQEHDLTSSSAAAADSGNFNFDQERRELGRKKKSDPSFRVENNLIS